MTPIGVASLRLQRRIRGFRIANGIMMGPGKRKRRPFTKGLCLNTALSLLFFLAFSAPHRVHHVFENTAPAAHTSAHRQSHDRSTGDSRHDQSPPDSKQGNCAVLTIAQTAPGSLVSLFSWLNFQCSAMWWDDQRSIAVTDLHFSPASPRAPPHL